MTEPNDSSTNSDEENIPSTVSKSKQNQEKKSKITANSTKFYSKEDLDKLGYKKLQKVAKKVKEMTGDGRIKGNVKKAELIQQICAAQEMIRGKNLEKESESIASFIATHEKEENRDVIDTNDASTEEKHESTNLENIDSFNNSNALDLRDREQDVIDFNDVPTEEKHESTNLENIDSFDNSNASDLLTVSKIGSRTYIIEKKCANLIDEHVEERTEFDDEPQNGTFATPNLAIDDRTYIISSCAGNQVSNGNKEEVSESFMESTWSSTPFMKKYIAPNVLQILQAHVQKISQETNEMAIVNSQNINTNRRIGINLMTPPRTPGLFSRKSPTKFTTTPRLDRLATPKSRKTSQNSPNSCVVHRHRGPLPKFVDTTKMSKKDHDEYLKSLSQSQACSCCKRF